MADQADGEVPRTDGGVTPQEILDKHTRHTNSVTYVGTEESHDALETFAREYVDESRIITSGSIANAVDTDIRPQEIGKTLGAHISGNTPDDLLSTVEVSKWSDATPVKWQFERVAGAVDNWRSPHLQKPELVREISDAIDADGVHYTRSERDGNEWTQVSVRVTWMRAVCAALCRVVDYRPTAVREDPELTREEWIQELTQAGTTRVIRRATGIDDPGADDEWNKSTVQSIHAILVEGRDPSEVVA